MRELLADPSFSRVPGSLADCLVVVRSCDGRVRSSRDGVRALPPSPKHAQGRMDTGAWLWGDPALEPSHSRSAECDPLSSSVTAGPCTTVRATKHNSSSNTSAAYQRSDI